MTIIQVFPVLQVSAKNNGDSRSAQPFPVIANETEWRNGVLSVIQLIRGPSTEPFHSQLVITNEKKDTMPNDDS